MKTIVLNINDNNLVDFFSKIKEFVKENNISEEDIKINNLTLLDFEKHYIIDSE